MAEKCEINPFSRSYIHSVNLIGRDIKLGTFYEKAKEIIKLVRANYGGQIVITEVKIPAVAATLVDEEGIDNFLEREENSDERIDRGAFIKFKTKDGSLEGTVMKGYDGEISIGKFAEPFIEAGFSGYVGRLLIPGVGKLMLLDAGRRAVNFFREDTHYTVRLEPQKEVTSKKASKYKALTDALQVL